MGFFNVIAVNVGVEIYRAEKNLTSPERAHALKSALPPLIKMIQQRLGEGDFVDSCLLKSLFVGDICQPNLPHAAQDNFCCTLFFPIHSLTQDFLLCPETCWRGFICAVLLRWNRDYCLSRLDKTVLYRRRAHLWPACTHREGDAHGLI